MTWISFFLPCCQKPVTLCPSQHDVVSCSDPVAYSGGASWCALFSREEKKKRFNLEIHDLGELITSIEFSAKHLPQSPIQRIVISVSAMIKEMGRKFRVQYMINAAECTNQIKIKKECRSYLQGAHGQSGDGLTLGHHRVHGLECVLQAAVGDVRLAGHVVDILDGGVSLWKRHADLVGWDRLDAKSGLGLSKGSTKVHQPGLRQLFHADVVFCWVIFGLGPQGRGGVGHEDIAAALRHAALALGTS